MAHSLIENCDNFIYCAKNWMNLDVSLSFAKCLNYQLTQEFVLKTGISIDRKYINIQVSFIERHHFLVVAPLSRWQLELYVNHNWIDTMIAWQSKSSKIYHPGAEVTDCNDLDIWFENLDAELMVELMYPDNKLPFKLKNLSYELEIVHLELDMRFQLYLHTEKEAEGTSAVQAIDAFIAKSNQKTEKKDTGEGIIHNWKREQTGLLLIYEIDMGSTGLQFLKKLLKMFSDLELFSKVVLG